jgi:hypothetical protein
MKMFGFFSSPQGLAVLESILLEQIEWWSWMHHGILVMMLRQCVEFIDMVNPNHAMFTD